jgi:hypothetical protein
MPLREEGSLALKQAIRGWAIPPPPRRPWRDSGAHSARYMRPISDSAFWSVSLGEMKEAPVLAPLLYLPCAFKYKIAERRTSAASADTAWLAARWG